MNCSVETRSCALRVFAVLFLFAGFWPISADLAGAEPHSIAVPGAVQSAAAETSLQSAQDAEAFLSRALPLATAGNPKYRSGDGETAWITKAIQFEAGPASTGVTVHMSEDVLEFRNGERSSAGSHETEFSLKEVQVSERTDSGDVTSSGEAARGIIFVCNAGKCIRSTTNGSPSAIDWTDIYIQDEALRSKILSAFKVLTKAAR